MRIAFVGTMGIPARYGGFETCVEEVATRLAERGHEVIVYCGYKGAKPKKNAYKGVKLVFIPCLRNKFLDFPFRGFTSTLDVLRRNVDIAHFFGSDIWPFTFGPRLMAAKTVLTLDGLVWQRTSYPGWVRKILRSTAGFALYLPNETIVDSKTVQKWYHTNFNKCPKYVPYGANIDLASPDEKTLKENGLANGKYIIFVGRLVREKGVHYLVEAFKTIKTDFKLVIIGGDPYGKEYESFLRKNANDNTMFLGYVYGKAYQDLCKGAYLYVTPSDLEGTSPALLTAMALGKGVLVSDIPENLETIGDAGFSFKHGNPEDLKEKLQFLFANPDEVEKIQKKAINRIRTKYDWNTITDQTEKIYFTLFNKHV
ncbi:MAG TPA: glycosyltransferase family 4 protein [Candidatus Nanoarchaeia archaeon]|nr:glycosyltransferase family 4 protein [Candidatus Nanoarchaeia archaeon]